MLHHQLDLLHIVLRFSIGEEVARGAALEFLVAMVAAYAGVHHWHAGGHKRVSGVP